MQNFPIHHGGVKEPGRQFREPSMAARRAKERGQGL
jgi:hypothetical protein